MTTAISREPKTTQPRSQLRYGDEFAGFVVNGFAGKGATSYVYKARRAESLEPIAVKVLHPHLLADPTKRRKFYREARIMMRMRHPNVVRFEEVVEADGVLAYVMEYIDGVTLEDWMAGEGRQADEMTLACLFVDILRGLTHAHRHGIVHRDMKPANILITHEEGRYVAKIIDFGLARFVDQPLSREERSKIAGTAAYISPEEVEDPEGVCESSDLYSLGVMMFEAACGRRPFDGETPHELLDAHVRREPPRPRELNPQLTPQFEEVILRTLSKHPDGRFASAPEMIQALEQAIQQAIAAQMAELQLDQAQTMEWSRAMSERSAHAKPQALVYMLMCLQMLMTVFATSGRTGQADDPHFLNRHDDIHLPFG